MGASICAYDLRVGSDAIRPIERWIQDVTDHQFDDVIFATGQGVRLLIELARELGKDRGYVKALGQCRLITRGTKPAKALAELGLHAAVRSESGSTDSLIEALSGLDFAGRTVALQTIGEPDNQRIATRVEEAGGTFCRISHLTAMDGQAADVLRRVVARDIDTLVFDDPVQIRTLMDAAEISNTHREFEEALSETLVLATDSVMPQLRARRIDARPLTPDAIEATSPDKIFMLLSKQPNAKSETPALTGGKKRIVVIGNGMVGYKFCEKLCEFDTAGQFELVVLCEEPLPAYDRVQLTSYFEEGKTVDDLLMAPLDWYKSKGIDLRVEETGTRIDREKRIVHTSEGATIAYDYVVLATGSEPFVPPVPGMDKPGVFVYRTIADLDAIIAYAKDSKSAAVIGGGLLGLEAAKAVHDLELDTHVVEFAPRLMPRQVDGLGGALLADRIRELGVSVHLNMQTTAVLGNGKSSGLRFKDGERLDVDMIVVSAGIRPRDEIAREAGLKVGERGGIVVDDKLACSDPDIFAIGECALYAGMIYGLVAPGYDMAEAVATVLTGGTASFSGADMSTKLKLMGVDVASFGDPFADEKGGKPIVFQDFVNGVYKKMVVSADGTTVLGGSLVGDASEYGTLLHYTKSRDKLPESPEDLILGSRGGGADLELPGTAQICSCNNVTKDDICLAIREQGLSAVGEVKTCTQAGAGCGGCLPMVTDILNAELAAAGKSVKPRLCEHFDHTRQELFDIIRVKKIKSFQDAISKHGSGDGCEICKPTVASILASTWNEMIVTHDTLQDTNDRFLANIQRGGLYSVIPRIPGGEITPKKLMALGRIAEKYNLYTKITGGQRIDLLGARVNQLPDIWEELIAEGFESGHAYGKALRTVKSCVGSTWCRYGVQDSVSFAIRVEERYRGLRAPHKIKSAVSGCTRECAEAQSKDFGIIATENGWNVYVCGNGGMKPRHADLLASDIDDETAIRYIDRFLMYYVRTADKLTRTSVWLDKLDGGIEHLKDVVINDSLGLCAELEKDMQYLVDTYACEWKGVVENPEMRAKFRHYANSGSGDDTVELIDERGQIRPADWRKDDDSEAQGRVSLPMVHTQWVSAGKVSDFPVDGGMAVQHGRAQIAVYNFSSRGEWYAVQNVCPHKKEQVLARGLIGDQCGTPKVACPLHKKTFSLKDGSCLSGEKFGLHTFPTKVVDGEVFVELPASDVLEKIFPQKEPEKLALSEPAQA